MYHTSIPLADAASSAESPASPQLKPMRRDFSQNFTGVVSFAQRCW